MSSRFLTFGMSVPSTTPEGVHVHVHDHNLLCSSRFRYSLLILTSTSRLLAFFSNNVRQIHHEEDILVIDQLFLGVKFVICYCSLYDLFSLFSSSIVIPLANMKTLVLLHTTLSKNNCIWRILQWSISSFKSWWIYAYE